MLPWREFLDDLWSGKLIHFRDGGGSKWVIDELGVNPLAVASQGLAALDGLLRFRPASALKRVPPTAKAVWSLLKPSSLAIAGVSEKMNMGRVIMRNVLSAGFDRNRLFILKDCSADRVGRQPA